MSGTEAEPVTTGVADAAGKVTVTSSPPPSIGSARTEPPCASETARTMDSPSPAPRGAGPLPSAAAERLEQPRHVAGVDLEPGVPDDQPGAALVAAGTHPEPSLPWL